MTGMCALQGKRGGPPEILYGSVVDYYAAALVAAGVASALYEREKSGGGPVRRRVAAALGADDAVGPHGVGRRRAARTWGATCAPAASPASTPRGTATSTSRPTRRTSGARCARRSAARTRARPQRYDSVRKRAQHRRRDRAQAARGAGQAQRPWSGRRCSAKRCPARPRARWRTCSTTSRCWPRTWWRTFAAPHARLLPRLHPAGAVRPHTGPDAFAAPTLGQHTAHVVVARNSAAETDDCSHAPRAGCWSTAAARTSRSLAAPDSGMRCAHACL